MGVSPMWFPHGRDARATIPLACASGELVSFLPALSIDWYRHAFAIDDLLCEESREVAPELWPLVSFRTVSEQAELVEDRKA